jgi:FkbM family methyltransferase
MCIDYFDRKSLNRWFADNGDKTHRLNYKLDSNSIVFDLGAYEGSWSADIINKFDCYVYMFEPVKEFYDLIVDKFSGNKKVKVYNFGFSNKEEIVGISMEHASSSIYSNGEKELIRLRNLNDFIQEEGISKIDLIKINIEGCEFDLMESLTDNNINIVDNFQIQFHKIGENPEIRRDNIRDRLSKTHKLTYDYTFVWENWEKI